MSVWMYVSFQRGLQSGYHSDLAPRDTNGRDKWADSLRLMTCGSATASSSGYTRTRLLLTGHSGLWKSRCLDLSLQGVFPQAFVLELAQTLSD